MPQSLKARMNHPGLLIPLWLAATCFAAAPARGEQPPEEEEPAFVGFDLGTFVLKDYQPLGDITTRLIFSAHASVKEEHADLFAKRLESRRNRVREQVIIAARLADPQELQDPDLKRLRRRMLLRIRHSLPELPIDKVYLSEFQLFAN